MKRITLVSPNGDKIEVTQDQVAYLKSLGWKVEGEIEIKSRVKAQVEVSEDGDI